MDAHKNPSASVDLNPSGSEIDKWIHPKIKNQNNKSHVYTQT